MRRVNLHSASRRAINSLCLTDDGLEWAISGVGACTYLDKLGVAWNDYGWVNYVMVF